MTTFDLPPIVRGYLVCALWASTDDSNEPLDDTFGIDDFAPEAIAEAIRHCEEFEKFNAADCDAYREQRTYDGAQGTVDDYLGHDLWLTRNRHGAGFWDRGLGALGERLTAAAHDMGEAAVFVDDGRIYFA